MLRLNPAKMEVSIMTEMVLNTSTLPELLSRIIPTEKVRVVEGDGEIRLIPVEEPIDYIAKLRGSLAAYPEMSVDKFLARSRADKELDRRAIYMF